MLFSYLAKRALAKFERRWNYDSAYAYEILDKAGFEAILPLDALAKVGKFRSGVPAAVYYAAKLAGSLDADCGPCARLTVSMARADGVNDATIAAIVAGNRDGLGPGERLAYDLARATIERTDATDVRAAIVERFGYRGLVSIAYALVAAQAFPTIKYALGYGHACERLELIA